MTDPLIPLHASEADGFLPGPLGLRLDEEHLPFSAVSAAARLLDSILPMGHVDGTTTLRLWPNTLWTTCDTIKARFTSVDISHGYCRLILRGVEALHFVANYTYADLMSQSVRDARVVRTRMNHFDCILWWHNTRDVNILVERSLAQSFCDHLRTLAQRHDPADPSETPRRADPAAPDRRG